MKKNIRDHKTNGQQFAYLLDSIVVTEYNEKGDYTSADQSDENKVRYVVDNFNAYEMNFTDSMKARRKKTNRAERIGDWLQGLPSNINIAFWDEEIINIGKSWGYCQTARKESEFVNRWFFFMGYRIEQLASHFGISFAL